MKKNIYFYLCAALLTMTLTGCFDDDSSTGYEAIKETTISGIDETYVKTAYVGEHLVISPEVTSSYSDSQMTYTWLLLDNSTGNKDKEGNVVEPVVIGNTKNLDYEVALAPGTYQVRLMASAADNGYSVYATTTLTVRTLFSQGFYILKKTADGNTDLDLQTLDGQHGEDLIAQVDGKSLEGSPVSLYPNYLMNYINTDNDKIESTNSVTVTTDRKVINVRRVSDFTSIFSRENICFDEMDADEQPYATTLSPTFGYMMMLTSKGLYNAASSSMSDSSTGQFGMPVSECGGSQYFYIDNVNFGCGAIWDATSHSLKAYNFNYEFSPLCYFDMTGEEQTQNLTNFECLHCGFNALAGTTTGIFVLHDNKTGNRYLYLTEGSFLGVNLSQRIQLPSDSHASRATSYSTNGISASYLYCIDGGKLYAYVFNSGDNSEVELKPEGIPSDETIVYVTNQYWNPTFSPGTPFDYLVVATQKGNSYKLYFYETNGGAPIGKPVMTTTGEGYVKAVRFINDGYATTDCIFGTQVYNIND